MMRMQKSAEVIVVWQHTKDRTEGKSRLYFRSRGEAEIQVRTPEAVERGIPGRYGVSIWCIKRHGIYGKDDGTSEPPDTEPYVRWCERTRKSSEL